MLRTRKGLLIIIVLALLGWSGFPWADLDETFSSAPAATEQGAIITTSAQKHILYGDHRGGGHKYGVGKACKSEFPKEWDNQKILLTVEQLAANDNLNWKKQQNGYYTAEEMVESVRVRVVLNRDRDEVVTAYPVNVKRNPCPAANDNYNQ